MYQKTWASKKGFFKGDDERPATEWEKFAVYALAGATIYLVIIRLYQWAIYTKIL